MTVNYSTAQAVQLYILVLITNAFPSILPQQTILNQTSHSFKQSLGHYGHYSQVISYLYVSILEDINHYGGLWLESVATGA